MAVAGNSRCGADANDLLLGRNRQNLAVDPVHCVGAPVVLLLVRLFVWKQR
jgi:hypothetical protein